MEVDELTRQQYPLPRPDYHCPRGVPQLHIGKCEACGSATVPKGDPVKMVCTHCGKEST